MIWLYASSCCSFIFILLVCFLWRILLDGFDVRKTRHKMWFARQKRGLSEADVYVTFCAVEDDIFVWIIKLNRFFWRWLFMGAWISQLKRPFWNFVFLECKSSNICLIVKNFFVIISLLISLLFKIIVKEQAATLW